MDFNITTVDATIIIVYLLFTVLLGFYFGKKHKNATDYFLAGRRLTWPIIGFSLFASNISSNSLVGLAGAGFKDGFSVFNYEWMAVLVLILFAIFFLPFYLKNKIFTIPEYLERRYSYGIRAYASAIAITLNILVELAATLYAGGLVINMIFPQFSLLQIIVGLAIIAGIYTISGGLAAVMYTDTLQAIFLVFGSILITFFALDKAGGWEAVTAITEPSHFDILKPADDEVLPWPSVFTGVLLLGFYFWGTNQYITQRTLAAKSVRQGQWGSMFAGFLKLGTLFIMVFPGAFARVLYPEMTEMDMVYPTLIFDLLPVGVLGIVVAGLVAAMMSSLDSGLNSVSTLVTMDFVQKFNKKASPKRLMNIGRIVTAIVAVIAVYWAPQISSFPKLWDYLQNMLAWFCPPVVALFVVGLFYKRANTTGAVLSAVIGFGITAILIGAQIIGTDLNLGNFLYVAFGHFIICCLSIVIGSHLSKAPSEDQQLAQLVYTLDTFKQETMELKKEAWYKNYRYQALALIIIAAVILYFF